MELTNSKRLLFTANYVTTELSAADQQKLQNQPGGVLKKLNFIRALELSQDDLKKIGTQVNRIRGTEVKKQMIQVLNVATRLAAHSTSPLEMRETIGTLPHTALIHFSNLVNQSMQSANISRQNELPNKLFDHSAMTGMLIEAYGQQQKISPVGWLYLERLEMYPVGVEKGELIFTVPMAPRETVTISHKEWSTSSQEYEQIVQDFFESYSERGVAEKTDSSMSTENEAKHSNAINFGATLTGGYGPVSLTTTLGLTSASEDRESIKKSMQQNREVTEKSSARARQEHKISMKLESKAGLEDSSFRTITNSLTKAVRIDYYRMMRKWRTDLFRYGLRMTYDITIPTPGVRLWARWQRIEELDAAIRVPFVFSLKPEDINDSTWTKIAANYKASVNVVPPPPAPSYTVTPPATILDYIPEDQSGIARFGKIDFEVPAGYWLKRGVATADVTHWASQASAWKWLSGSSTGNMTTQHFVGDLSSLYFNSGPMSVVYRYVGISFGSLTLLLQYERTPSAELAWQQAAWAAIKTSAEQHYQEELARYQEERDRIYTSLVQKDTLSLRQLEREEMLRLITLWLVGPDSTFSTAPSIIQDTSDLMLSNEETFLKEGVLPPGNVPMFKGVNNMSWSQALLFGELVKFIHQAVEWENLLYFLYPYFWGSEEQGRDKLLFQHTDPEHEKFLRAGYVRVVITVRPDFEEAFTQFVETGSLNGEYTSPYLSIATDIANFARTNYTGIPPANPEKHSRPLLYPQQRKSWDLMQAVIKLIEQYKTDNGNYPETLADLPGSPFKDAWGNNLIYNNPGSGNDYDLISYGADGKEGGDDINADISSAAGASCVATWFDYTPTSGIDLEVDTKPEDIA